MPTYEYEIPEIGLKFTARRSVAERDRGFVVRRRRVPAGVAIAGTAQDPHDFDVAQARGYRKLEERGALSRRRSEFTKDQIKTVLGRK